jgi:hypothetical protein
MKKALFALIIAVISTAAIAAQESAVLGSWMTWQGEELLEFTFESNNVLTLKTYSSYSETADVDTEMYMIMDDIINIDGDTFNYFLVNNKLILYGQGDLFVLSRKTVNTVAEARRLIVGTWSVTLENGSTKYTAEFNFKNDGTLTARSYENGSLSEEDATPYSITDTNIVYLKNDDAYYPFRITANKLYIAGGEGFIFTKK